MTRLWFVAAALSGALGLPAPGGATPLQEPPAPDASPSPSPSPEAAPATPEEPATSLIEKLGTFGDVEQLDLEQLLNVSAAGGTALTQDDAPGLVTVVTEEDIRRLGARTLDQVVRALTGFDVVTDNLGRGRIVVRGVRGGITSGGSENVLVLLNGVRINEVVTGGATAVNLQLPVDNIKRIEAVRGPGSVAYGPNAFLGVLNIVTESTDTFRKHQLTVGGGSFGTLEYNFRYGTSIRNVSLAGFLQYFRTEGPELPVAEDTQTAIDRALAQGRIQNFAPASLAPGHTFGERKSVDSNIGLAYRDLTLNLRMKQEAADAFIGLLDALGDQGRLANRQYSATGSYRHRLAAGDLRLTASYMQSTMEQFLDVQPRNFTALLPDQQSVLYPSGLIFRSTLGSRRASAGLVFERPLGARHTLLVGASADRSNTYGLEALSNFDFLTRGPLPLNSLREDGLQDLVQYVPAARRTVLGAFVQDTWMPHPRVSLAGGVRVDRYSDFDAEVVPRAAFVWRMPRDVNLKLAYGRAVRVPSFQELFYTSPAAFASTSLVPATIDSYEAGLLFRRGGLRVGANAFVSVIDDLVGLVRQPGSAVPYRTANVPGIESRGVELEASRSVGRASFQGRYTFQRPEDRVTGRRAPLVPSHLGHLAASIDLGRRVQVMPNVTYRGERPREEFDPRAPLEASTVVDAHVLVRQVHPRVDATASVLNVFDVEYAEPSPWGGVPGDYPRPGRAFFLRLNIRIGQ